MTPTYEPMPGSGAPPEPDNQCARCKQSPAEGDFPTPLCAPCRQSLIRYPIPKWMLLVAAALFVGVIVGLWRLPTSFNARLHLARAEKAMDQHRYATAEKELDKVLLAFPGDEDANISMLIAASYNLDFLRAQPAYLKLEHSQSTDESLIGRVQKAVAFMEQSLTFDTLFAPRLTAAMDSPAALCRLYDSVKAEKGIHYPMNTSLIAGALFDHKENMDSCWHMLNEMLVVEPHFYRGMVLMIAVEREQKRFDAAIERCEELLKTNAEDVNALAQLAKIEMKRHDDKKAAEWAAKASAVHEYDIATLEVQGMLAHFAGRNAESRKYLDKLRTAELVTGDSSVTVHLTGILNGTISYR